MAENERHLQETLRARTDLRRVEGDLVAFCRDHTMVSSKLVRWKRVRTRSLEEDGSRLHRRLAQAERSVTDVSTVVDERLN